MYIAGYQKKRGEKPARFLKGNQRVVIKIYQLIAPFKNHENHKKILGCHKLRMHDPEKYLWKIRQK